MRCGFSSPTIWTFFASFACAAKKAVRLLSAGDQSFLTFTAGFFSLRSFSLPCSFSHPMILTMAPPPQMRTRPAVSSNYDFRRSSVSSASDILMRVYRNFNPLADTLCNVMDLLTLEEAWNGYDAARPNARSV
jgi:hypothetical protein